MNDNRQFIDTIVACSNINVYYDVLEKLRETDVDIKEIYKKMIKYHSKGGTDNLFDINNYIIKNLYWIVSAYEIMDDKEKFMRTYKEILDLLLKFKVYSTVLPFFGLYMNELKLHRDLWMFRVINVYQKGIKLGLNGKDVKVLYEIFVNGHGDEYAVLSLDGDTSESIGGIFIKNGEMDFRKVRNNDEQVNLVLSILHDDYDLVIVPNIKLLDFKKKNKISNTEADNKTYLRFLELTENIVTETLDYKEYWKIQDSKINMTSILSLIRKHGMFEVGIIEFASLMIDKFEKEPDKLIELDRIRKALDEKSDILSESEFANYLEFTNSLIEKTNVDRTIKLLEKAL